MPIYDYKCSLCEHVFELFFKSYPTEQNIDDIECPICKSKDVKKILSKTDFVLKGSGWFKDGYEKTKPAKIPDTTE